MTKYQEDLLWDMLMELNVNDKLKREYDSIYQAESIKDSFHRLPVYEKIEFCFTEANNNLKKIK